jgi:hypothetical protein
MNLDVCHPGTAFTCTVQGAERHAERPSDERLKKGS